MCPLLARSKLRPAVPAILPNILGNTGNAPKPVLQTLNISQGVSQGLLTKKVQPIYPANSLRMHVEEPLNSSDDRQERKHCHRENTKLEIPHSLAPPRKPPSVEVQTYLLNGEPVEIQTQITVNFKLPK